MELNHLFKKDFARSIETVIKADDKSHILQEVEEYVITNEISLKLADFFEQYNNYEGANGVWISGFFGSGKSHLLKILSYVLEDRTAGGAHLGELFAQKVEEDAKLKGDILNGTRIPSESILFNIDQQAQITTKEDENAILQVFYKVLYDHQGFYGFQPHVAEFEHWLSKEGNYGAFKEGFQKEFGSPWETARNDYVDPMIEDAIAEVCGNIYDVDPSKYQGILDKFEDTRKYSIEDFAHKVDRYLQQQPEDFRLNFYVDEVGQYIADNTKLMLNLQTIAESLATKCNGRSWIIVTSQEDLESVVGDEAATQSDDFSKIQGRFKIRLPLTSANVDEVIEKRLLAKGPDGEAALSSIWQKEKDNLATLLSFSEAGVQFKNYEGQEEFIAKYPFIPYQFDLFQQSIKTLAKHNAFQGKHASVGERSMLGVFQEVLKDLNDFDERSVISFDQLFEGLKGTMRTEIQNSIILAQRQLSSRPLAVRILKALFLVKYYDSFKTTLRNIAVLTLNHLNVNPNAHEEEIKEALNLLEQQNYIERKSGDIYEFMTDIEKDIKQEIKNTEINFSDTTDLLSSLLFDGTIKETRLQFQENKQYYEYTRKVDGTLYGREKELTVELVTPNSENYDNQSYFQGLSMGNQTHMLMRLAPDDRIVKDARLYLQTQKYIKQNQATSNKDRVKQILFEQGQQNQERKREMLDSLNDMLAQSTVYLNGTEHRVSSTGDGKTKVIYAFQDLVKLAYSKLKMLGDTTFDESRLRSIMRGRQDDLFGADDASITPPEKEVLNFIRRRKKMNERTTLTDLKKQFTQKPYGWPDFAIWCMVAMLFKRGKIIAKQDSNIIEDTAFEGALMNNRSHGNTLVYPQIEFDQGQVHKLKQIHQDLFNESNPHNEAKDAATLFKEKTTDELEAVRNLIAQKRSYPFVEQLQPMADKLRRIKEMDYATVVTEIAAMEAKLLDIKEDTLDPIKQFMKSGQKEIYDRLNEFDSYNQANFDYVDAQEKEVLQKAKEAPTPYRGATMREAKEAMDTLEDRVQLELKGEKDATIERYKEAIENLKTREEFSELSNPQKEQVMGPLQQELKKAKDERFIGNLRDQRSRLSSHLFTDQLNMMIALAQPEEEDGKQDKPKRRFIKETNLHPSFSKKELETEEDVDDYLEALRKSMIDHIKRNHNILLD